MGKETVIGVVTFVLTLLFFAMVDFLLTPLLGYPITSYSDYLNGLATGFLSLAVAIWVAKP